MTTNEVITTSVIFYNATKGWGFLELPNSDRGLFFHHSDIVDGYILEEGDLVSYVESTDGSKRPRAIEVTLLEE